MHFETKRFATWPAKEYTRTIDIIAEKTLHIKASFVFAFFSSIYACLFTQVRLRAPRQRRHFSSSRSEKVTFPGSQGFPLAARLDYPDGEPKALALFAHCFTCSKDIFAASRIAGELADRGFAVLRFDFTGLGMSGGEFANTNFSSNVQDIVAAADYLRQNIMPADILIGHSLGGAAVLAAAGDIPEVKAVATIGAPSDAAHVIHNFAAHVDEIRDKGEASVSLAGRQFTIKKQFLDDCRNARGATDRRNAQGSTDFSCADR